MPAALPGRTIVEPVKSVGKVDRVGVVTTRRSCCFTYRHREATGVDFRRFDGDLEAARAAGAEAVQQADAGSAAARAIAGALL